MEKLVVVFVLCSSAVIPSLGQFEYVRDQATQQIQAFHSGVNSNQCKFSISHYGKNVRGRNGFDTQWETQDGDINRNREILSGIRDSVDTSRETLSGAGRLAKIRFWPFGNSATCIKSVTIACGSDAVAGGGGYTHITREHMNEAWRRKGAPRHVASEPENDCVRFNRNGHYYGYKAMDIGPDVFTCDLNNVQCIQSHLEMF